MILRSSSSAIDFSWRIFSCRYTTQFFLLANHERCKENESNNVIQTSQTWFLLKQRRIAFCILEICIWRVAYSRNVSIFRYTEAKGSESSYGNILCTFSVYSKLRHGEYFLLVCLGDIVLDISETLRAYVKPKWHEQFESSDPKQIEKKRSSHFCSKHLPFTILYKQYIHASLIL